MQQVLDLGAQMFRWPVSASSVNAIILEENVASAGFEASGYDAHFGMRCSPLMLPVCLYKHEFDRVSKLAVSIAGFKLYHASSLRYYSLVTYFSASSRMLSAPILDQTRLGFAQEANRRHDLSLVEYLVKEVFFYVGLDHLRMSARLRRHPTIQAR